MDAAANGVAEEQDDEHGIDQQDVLYRMVFFPDLCSSRHQMVDVALLMRYIPRSCNWGENRRSAASICDLDHSEGNHGSTFPPVRSRPYGLWAKSCGWWTRRRRRRSRRPFGGGCYISPRIVEQQQNPLARQRAVV